MGRTLFAVGAVAVVLLAGGLAFASGYGPAPGGAGEADADAEEFPTATPTPEPTDDGSSGDEATSTATPTTQPFAVVIEQVEECGETCRDVTVSLTNRQSDAASDVTVYTRVFAGNSTDDGDVVWRGTEAVGSLGAGETHTTTKRVELSYSEALAVERADGWVTVQTTIETADRTVTFSERRNVG